MFGKEAAMSYEKQVDILAAYLKEGETDPDDFKLGIELEHFIVQKDSLEAVSYYEDKGIESLLKELVKLGWRPLYEGRHLIQLQKSEATITLEPGGQVEISILPQRDLRKINEIYSSFLDELVYVLDKWNKAMIAVGYQPHSLIKDIQLLPKERYRHMFEYFKKKGKYAHNMMKGTASIQVSVDYSSEKDYIMKNRVANFLSTLIYCIFDNVPFYEGNICKENSMRGIIWDNCDNDRCGFPDKVFTNDFGYRSYAGHLLNTPPIIIKKNNKLIYTGGKLLKEVFETFNPDFFSKQELEHLVSMLFLDVRTKSYIEVRTGDALPYPYSLGYAALWKGLLYNSENLCLLYEESKRYDKKAILELKERVKIEGIFSNIGNRTLMQKFKDILILAEKGLGYYEKGYLRPLKVMAEKQLTPKMFTLGNLRKGKKEALKWCVMRRTNHAKRCDRIACC